MEEDEKMNLIIIGFGILFFSLVITCGLLIMQLRNLRNEIITLRYDYQAGDEALSRRINNVNEDIMAVQVTLPELWTDISEIRSILKNTNRALSRTLKQIKDDPKDEQVVQNSGSRKEETMHEVFAEEEIDMINQASETADNSQEGMSYAGYYELTAYEYTGSTCANGNMPTVGYTVACNSLPLGTQIYIEGYGYYVVEDTGGMGGNVIDIYLGDPGACIQFGRQGANVYIVN